MQDQSARQPVFNAPTVVIALIALMALVHVGLDQFVTDDPSLLFALAFIPARYVASPDPFLPGGAVAAWTSPFTHMFLHGGWLHLVMNSAWLLAFGAIIARRMNVFRFLVYFLLCGLAGAGLFYLVNMGELKPVVGASGAVSGLMGGVFRFLFNARRASVFGASGDGVNIPRMPLGVALLDRSVLLAIVIWLGINAIFATDVGQMLAEGEIAWEAHVGGFLAGFLLLGLVDQVPLRRLSAVPTDEDQQDNHPWTH